MKNVHISLVGGQPTPVYVGIICNLSVDEIVLICSTQTREDADRIQKIYVEREIEKKAIECIIKNDAELDAKEREKYNKELNKKFKIKEWSPVELLKIYESTEALKDVYKDCEVTLNLTSGTKLWALALFDVFGKMENAKFFYVDQNNVITDITTRKTFHPQEIIDPATRFELHGTPLSSKKLYTEYTDADFKVIKEIETLRQTAPKEFNNLIKLGKNQNKVELENGATLEYNRNEKEVKIKLVYKRWVNKRDDKNNIIKTKETKEKSSSLKSPHVYDLVFNSGWFELKAARALVEQVGIQKESIQLNCIFSDKNGKAKNEIDIIANLGNRLLFVECKTMIYESTDIDKFNSALKNFSGISSAKLFMTNDQPPKEENDNPYWLAMDKCDNYKIGKFNFYLDKNKGNINTVMQQKALKDIVGELRNIQNKK